MTSNRGSRRIVVGLALTLAALAVDAFIGSAAVAGGCHKKVYVLVDADPAPAPATTQRVVRRYYREVAAPDATADRDLATPQAATKEAPAPPKTNPVAVAPRAAEQAAAPRTVTRRVLRTYVEEEEVPATETREATVSDAPVTRVVRVVRAAPAERVVYVRDAAPAATQAVLVTKRCCLFGKGY